MVIHNYFTVCQIGAYNWYEFVQSAWVPLAVKFRGGLIGGPPCLYFWTNHTVQVHTKSAPRKILYVFPWHCHLINR